MRLSEIKLNPSNPRIIKDEKFERLKNSIKEFPKMMELRPMVLNSENMVLGGNMRLRALQDLGYEEIPDNWIKKAQELSEEEIRKFIILDNASFGEWEWEALANEYEVEELKDWGVDVPAFFGQNEATEDDYEIPEEIQTDIVLGDIFEIGQHTLICADATEEPTWQKLSDMAKINKTYCCFTSPPYNVGKNAKTRGHNANGKDSFYIDSADDLSDDEYKNLLTNSLNNAINYTGGIGYNVQSLASNKKILLDWLISFHDYYVDIITWDKLRAAPAIADSVLSSRFEWICIFNGEKKSKRTIPLSSWRGTITNIYSAPQLEGNKNKSHLAAFPVHLPSFIISELMNKCSGIIDCFGGTGTSMVAAHQLGRISTLIELSPIYCQVIIDRMLKLDPSLEVKKNGEKYVSREINSEIIA